MDGPFDIYCDAFTITITPWGANMSFDLREPHPAPTSIQQPKRLGTIRMSNEHLKTLIFMLRQQMMKYEEETGARAEVPTQILAQLGIAPEDWDVFWASQEVRE